MMTPEPVDRLLLRGIEGHGHHGVHDFERRDGQLFVVDLELVVDLGPAARADDLSRTVDYGDLAMRVRAAIESDPVDLIETLAERIAGICLGDERVRRAVVTVHKPHAPVGTTVSDVAVRIERSRS